jgi:hypothetical protein
MGYYWDDITREDLPVSVRSLSRVIPDLEQLLADAIGVPGLRLLIKQGRKPARLSRDAVAAWVETEACLRCFLPPDWFGFRLAPSLSKTASPVPDLPHGLPRPGALSYRACPPAIAHRRHTSMRPTVQIAGLGRMEEMW